MSQFVFVNNVQTTLAAPITSPSQTVIEVSSSANLPALTTGQQMALTLNDAATGEVFEIVYVTSISGSNLTVTRGQEGTTAQTWLTGDAAYSDVTAGVLAAFVQSANAGQPKVGLISNVPVGSATAFSFPTAFPNSLAGVVCGISAAAGDLSNYGHHTDSETKSGFNITPTGGTAATVNVWYIAFGS